MSLTATHSMSAPRSYAARNTFRPIRPKPLIPTRTGMPLSSALEFAAETANADALRLHVGDRAGYRLICRETTSTRSPSGSRR